MTTGSIGVFDSGYGGLTVLRSITSKLPQYNYLYLGDNARAPYGSRSFDTVYQYTLQCVEWFFKQGCPLVILACNTASAKALRTIQQNDLARFGADKRVLGVIRPTTEIIGQYTKTGKVGILATSGTVLSGSYPIEINKFFPDCEVYQEACPMWVPLIENNEHNSPGAAYFIEKHINHLLAQSNNIDTILLACTHYPLLMEAIKKVVPSGTTVLSQGEMVANSLADYLQRHLLMENNLSKGGQVSFFTTDDAADFDTKGSLFYGKPVKSTHIDLK
jgi:glutamate racemase